MNNQDVEAFLDRLGSSEDLRQQVSEAMRGCDDAAAAVVEYARGQGYEFSVEVFRATLEARYADRELSDQQLEAIAGGMFPAVTTASGIAIAFPDVCKTPSPGGPVPVPYPNIGIASRGRKSGGKA